MNLKERKGIIEKDKEGKKGGKCCKYTLKKIQKYAMDLKVSSQKKK